MSLDNRFTAGLVFDVLDVLERHGYTKADDRSVGIAYGFLADLVRAYEGQIDSFRDPRTPAQPGEPESVRDAYDPHRTPRGEA